MHCVPRKDGAIRTIASAWTTRVVFRDLAPAVSHSPESLAAELAGTHASSRRLGERTGPCEESRLDRPTTCFTVGQDNR